MLKRISKEVLSVMAECLGFPNNISFWKLAFIHSFIHLPIHSFIQPTYFVHLHETRNGARPWRHRGNLVTEGKARFIENLLYLRQYYGSFQSISGLVFTATYMVGRVTMPVWNMKKLKVRQVKWLASSILAGLKREEWEFKVRFVSFQGLSFCTTSRIWTQHVFKKYNTVW